MSRFRETIRVKDSPHFSGWSKIERINLKDVYNLFELLKKYSYIVSDGSLKIDFLREEQILESEKSLISSSERVYVNVKSLLDGEIDGTIGEIIFSLLAKDALKESNIIKLLRKKIQGSDVKVTKGIVTHVGTYNLKEFLSNKYLIDASNYNRKTLLGSEYYSGAIKIIDDLKDVQQDSSSTEGLDKVIVNALKQAQDVSASVGLNFRKLEHIISCVFFFYNYVNLNENIVKYCESFVKNKMKDETSFFDVIFTDMALAYLFDDCPTNSFVKDFFSKTNLHSLDGVSKEEIVKRTYMYFEPVIEEQLQCMLDSVPVSELISVDRVESLKEKVEGISLVEADFIKNSKNIMSLLKLEI